jgi:hypothetical protein
MRPTAGHFTLFRWMDDARAFVVMQRRAHTNPEPVPPEVPPVPTPPEVPPISDPPSNVPPAPVHDPPAEPAPPVH